MTEKTIMTLDELDRIAEEILNTATQHSLSFVALSGELGAGKTALVKAFAHLLSITEEVTSPTFVIMKSYEIKEHARFKTLTHIDAYRIDDEKEMTVLHFEALSREPNRFVCVEWPERIQNLIPHSHLAVTLTLNTDGSRTIAYDIKT